MTRVTNVGRKRTYLEAGLSEPQRPTNLTDGNRDRKKRRKRTTEALPAVKSELRRRQRIENKKADTTCFACREKGHAVKDCPTAAAQPERRTSGICYRCGSSRHSLSKCRRLPQEGDPLPFASCFVCKAQGHLASGCPENTSKGVYPNGGCCKICGVTSHLAKKCKLRTTPPEQDNPSVYGTGQGVGADEDDFHNLKRKAFQLDKEEKKGEKLKQRAVVETGARLGAVQSSNASTKKVVYF